jgi:hypothetical protein
LELVDTFWLAVDPNGNPLVAAEPVFHQQTPSGVDSMAVPFGHALRNLPELLKNFTENARAFGAM